MSSKSAPILDEELVAAYINSLIYPEISLSRVRYLKSKIFAVPHSFYALSRYHDSRVKAIIRNLQAGAARYQVTVQEGLTSIEERVVAQSYYDLSIHSLHFGLFYHSFLLQSSEIQRQEWVSKMQNLEIIGCYAQTELGHGSNVRGIETEAVYDHATKELVINTPNTSSYKWWVGGLGLVCNHVLLIAQLKIDGKSYGPHPFLVQIRDMQTHEPLPGVDVGDIGPKIAANGTDNGFLGFKNVRIPKNRMLGRYSHINDQGEYQLINKNSIKILYLSLVKGRFDISISAWFPLTMALTISIRYSNFRKQFSDSNSKGVEKPIISYQIQQQKLFRALGFNYGILYIRNFLNDIYGKAEQELNELGKSTFLNLAHSVLSLFKVFITQFTAAGIETCRRSCGGHGFLAASGLSSLYTNYLANVTYEGDNSIMALQAIKSILKLSVQKERNLFTYLSEKIEKPSGDFNSPEFVQQCFECISQFKVQNLYKKHKELVSKGLKNDVIWNNHLQVEGTEAAESIFHAVFHKCYLQGSKGEIAFNDQGLVQKLRTLYAANELEQYKGELILNGVEIEKLSLLKQESLSYLPIIERNAVVLIEAFEIRDETLNSVIGKKNANVYEDMLNTAKSLNGLNKRKNLAKKLKDFVRPKI